ncbi:alpha/beta hydrolase [Streptomyces tibetensis]|uniref:alpha/beta hydrolase n=1 Tax=Streptomyces tibetensis TaxID=2382123 RepID=UPI0033FBC97C
MELVSGYERGLLIERVSPTPMLMIVGELDVVCPPDLQLGAYARAREPKRLLTVPAGHFDVYKAGPAFDRVADAAADFFAEHLR